MPTLEPSVGDGVPGIAESIRRFPSKLCISKPTTLRIILLLVFNACTHDLPTPKFYVKIHIDEENDGGGVVEIST
ncbi:hypothetical protein PM082_024051 [Marasmius tenuissimus]|nr:hypothetical protein PM082_024051 [Marasmius tenuissimus]